MGQERDIQFPNKVLIRIFYPAFLLRSFVLHISHIFLFRISGGDKVSRATSHKKHFVMFLVPFWDVRAKCWSHIFPTLLICFFFAGGIALGDKSV